MSDELIVELLGDAAEDPGCDGCLALLAAWADARHGGRDADAEYAGVAVHLHNCGDCREDADGLIALLET